ncbi:hypothetical protein BN77_3874 [Rhizobium mesoamericanum STM3625]|uniref:Uncharacterized protein n=1 Tax=Rhizobium mesoamericanum STM3625 TaxID=1211777 RepID=K0PZB3_9HYPH|nr:hypothetical protein BN77_3874 [Rhizobium mesoamericanum STM3625]
MSKPNYKADSPVQLIDPYNDFLSKNGKTLPGNSAIMSRRSRMQRLPSRTMRLPAPAKNEEDVK